LRSASRALDVRMARSNRDAALALGRNMTRRPFRGRPRSARRRCPATAPGRR
jgi:hypothetical protein